MKSWIPTLCVALLAVVAQDGTKDASMKNTMPKVGALAPSFRLNDHTGSAVSVGGKSETWKVLAFFPKAMTPG